MLQLSRRTPENLVRRQRAEDAFDNFSEAVEAVEAYILKQKKLDPMMEVQKKIVQALRRNNQLLTFMVSELALDLLSTLLT